jgi:hypothetical protein
MREHVRWYETRLKGFCNSLKHYSKENSIIIIIEISWRVCVTLLTLLQAWLPNSDPTEWELQSNWWQFDLYTHSFISLCTVAWNSLRIHVKITKKVKWSHADGWWMYERHVQGFGNQDCNPISWLVPNCTNCLWIFIIIQANCSKTVSKHFSHIKATRYNARITRINTQFDREIRLIHLGTKLQE